MSAMNVPGPIVRKPQPDVYTLLLLVAILLLAVGIGVVLHNLTTTYGMSVGDIFSGKTNVPAVPAK